MRNGMAIFYKKLKYLKIILVKNFLKNWHY